MLWEMVDSYVGGSVGLTMVIERPDLLVVG